MQAKTIENSIKWQMIVFRQSKDKAQKLRCANAIAKLTKELELATMEESKQVSN